MARITLGEKLEAALVNNQKHLDKIASLESTVKDLEAKLAARGNAPSATPSATDAREAHKCYAVTDVTRATYWNYVTFRRIACRAEGLRTASYLSFEEWAAKWMGILVPTDAAPAAESAPVEEAAEAEYTEDFAPVEDAGLDNTDAPF